MCQELTSGFGIKEFCWVKEKGSASPKSGKMCVLLQCWDFFPVTLFPGESCWCSNWWNMRLSQKYPKETCVFLLSALEHTEGKKAFPLEPGLLLEGKLRTHTGESRSWWSLYSPTQGKLFLFLVLRPLCFYCCRELQRCLNTGYGSESCTLHTKGRKCRMWAGCKITSPSPFQHRWNAD